jgi:hypothetical protein
MTTRAAGKSEALIETGTLPKTALAHPQKKVALLSRHLLLERD